MEKIIYKIKSLYDFEEKVSYHIRMLGDRTKSDEVFVVTIDVSHDIIVLTKTHLTDFS